MRASLMTLPGIPQADRGLEILQQIKDAGGMQKLCLAMGREGALLGRIVCKSVTFSRLSISAGVARPVRFGVTRRV